MRLSDKPLPKLIYQERHTNDRLTCEYIESGSGKVVFSRTTYRPGTYDERFHARLKFQSEFEKHHAQ